jgi:hypothetical protein
MNAEWIRKGRLMERTLESVYGNLKVSKGWDYDLCSNVIQRCKMQTTQV